MIIELPFPPSVNTYWRMFQNRMIISKAGRQYREAALAMLKAQGFQKRLEGKLVVSIEAFRPDNRVRDVDNYLKAPLDALTHAGVYSDDSQICDLRIYWADEKGGKIRIYLEER